VLRLGGFDRLFQPVSSSQQTWRARCKPRFARHISIKEPGAKTKTRCFSCVVFDRQQVYLLNRFSNQDSLLHGIRVLNWGPASYSNEPTRSHQPQLPLPRLGRTPTCFPICCIGVQYSTCIRFIPHSDHARRELSSPFLSTAPLRANRRLVRCATSLNSIILFVRSQTRAFKGAVRPI